MCVLCLLKGIWHTTRPRGGLETQSQCDCLFLPTPSLNGSTSSTVLPPTSIRTTNAPLHSLIILRCSFSYNPLFFDLVRISLSFNNFHVLLLLFSIYFLFSSIFSEYLFFYLLQCSLSSSFNLWTNPFIKSSSSCSLLFSHRITHATCKWSIQCHIPIKYTVSGSTNLHRLKDLSHSNHPKVHFPAVVVSESCLVIKNIQLSPALLADSQPLRVPHSTQHANLCLPTHS